jgi:hypothetical protein
MGYDMSLNKETNYCECCKRSNVAELDTYYMSYNHSWAFYKWLDSKEGVRWIYDKPMVEVCKRLNSLIDSIIVANGNTIPTHELDVNGDVKWSEEYIRTLDDSLTLSDKTAKDDGWAITMFNAYRCATELLQMSSKHIDDEDVYWHGD